MCFNHEHFLLLATFYCQDIEVYNPEMKYITGFSMADDEDARPTDIFIHDEKIFVLNGFFNGKVEVFEVAN
jgi:hypothetical protein